MFENNIKDIKLAQSGDESAMSMLVINNQKLVWSIVRRFKGRSYEIEDLYQIGNIGLIKAIKNFDTNFDVQLSTYAVPYILGEIKRFIRDDGMIKVSRSIKELQVKIKNIQEENIKKNIEISISDISKILNVTKEEIVYALEAEKQVESLNQSDNNDDNREKILKIPANENQENIIINKMILKQEINRLNDMEKKIILLRFYKDKTQCEVGKIIGISQVQVSRIEKKVLQHIKNKMEA